MFETNDVFSTKKQEGIPFGHFPLIGCSTFFLGYTILKITSGLSI